MGKTREFFKKIRDTKGIFQAKMGTMKARNSKDLTEAEETRNSRLKSPVYASLPNTHPLPGFALGKGFCK